MTDSVELRERKLDAVIAEYYESAEGGKTPDPEAFLAAHAEFADELRGFLATVSELDRAVRTVGLETAPTRVLRPLLSDPLDQGVGVRYFGDYEILEVVGIGGMGIVYKARQSSLKRIVALKMIRGGELANLYDVQRFEAEARAVAKLSHPAIVSVHEVGIFEGRHFFTMDFVQGGGLSQLHRDQPVACKRAAELILTLADAIHHAHLHGIIHRDLKPANILLTEDGHPRITDFGLAKQLPSCNESQSVALTETGQILGTAGYMSPEQAAGKSSLVGPAVDIYALGAVLYALLTSRVPFVGESQAATILQVINQDPISPRALNPSVPKDLETICLKCLEKEPHRRYGTARLLAEDLQHYLAGRPVTARPIGTIGRGWRWCRRNPILAPLIAAVALSLSAGILVSWHFADQERQARETADRQKQASDRLARLAGIRQLEAEENARLARRHLYCSHLNLVQSHVEAGRIASALHLLECYRPKPETTDLRGFEWHYWMRQCHSEQVVYQGHTNTVVTVAFSVDGTKVITASHDRTAKVWEALSGNLLLTLAGHGAEVREAAFSPDGATIATASWDRTVRIWDATTGRVLKTLEGHLAKVDSVAYSPDGKTIASAGRDGTIRFWHANSGKKKDLFYSNGNPDCGIAFSSDGKQLVSSHKFTARVWEIETRKLEPTLSGHTDDIRNVKFSPDGKTIVTASYDGTAKLWDAATGSLRTTLTGHQSAVNAIAFSPDGSRLASVSSDQTIRIWDAKLGSELVNLTGHTSYVVGVAFSPDGTRIASSSWDTTAKLWNAATTSQRSRKLSGHQGIVRCVCFSRDGELLASGGDDSTIRLWNPVTGSEIRSLKSEHGGVRCVAFNANGKVLAAAAGDHTIKLWDAETGRLEKTLTGHSSQINRVAYSPDGTWIISASDDRTVRIWNATDDRLGQTLEGHLGSVRDVGFSPDGKWIVSASADNSVKIWEVSKGVAGWTLKHQKPVGTASFSHSGSWIASGSGRNTIKLWNLLTGQEVLTAHGHSADTIFKIGFDPVDARLATASGDGTVKLWDAGTGEELLTLHDQTRHVYDMAISPDGKRIASATYEGSIRIWDATHLTVAPENWTRK